MSEKQPPQPITRVEFEAGVKFDTIDNFGPFQLCTTSPSSRYIEDKYKSYYCHIQFVEDDGFTFISYIFDNKVEGKFLFSKCFKSVKQ